MPKNGITQWGWAELEELLQCPVCLDVPTCGPGNPVEQCVHGHHICASCKTQVGTCPLCKCEFLGTRNFVVEEIARHLEILKNTMLLNNIISEPKKKERKTCLNADAPVFNPNTVAKRNVNTPNADKGDYPCRVAGCDKKFSAARLLNHVRSLHGEHLTESAVDFTDTYNQTLEVPFVNKKAVNRISYVIFVSGIGLIFVNFEILRQGHLIVVLQMAMKYRHAQNYLICMDLFNESISYSYNTRLVSVRDNMEHMLYRKENCYVLTKKKLKSICVNRKFNCKIRLSRFNSIDIRLLTIPNTDEINIVTGIRLSLLEEENNSLRKQLKGQDNTNNRQSNSTVNRNDSNPSRIRNGNCSSQGLGNSSYVDNTQTPSSSQQNSTTRATPKTNVPRNRRNN